MTELANRSDFRRGSFLPDPDADPDRRVALIAVSFGGLWSMFNWEHRMGFALASYLQLREAPGCSVRSRVSVHGFHLLSHAS